MKHIPFIQMPRAAGNPEGYPFSSSAMRIPAIRILLSALVLGFLAIPANGAEILWSQYCQHLGKMKLLVHLDTDPTAATEGESEPVKL